MSGAQAPNLYARNRDWQRDLDIARDYFVYGETSRDLAGRYGLTRGRVHQIVSGLARKHGMATDQTPHLRLPDDIAAHLDARRHQKKHHPAAGGKYIVKVWTPQDVEAETMAGYWRVRHVNNPKLWSLRAKRKKEWLDREKAPYHQRQIIPPGWGLADYCRALGIPAPTQSPASDAPHER